MRVKHTLLSLLLAFFYVGETFSQSIGINTIGAAADGSALLEIGKGTAGTPDTKGVLIPRVNLSATNNNAPIGSWVNGLLVYNLANAGAFSTNVVANTFYYCDGTQWLRLNGSLNGDWTLTGNALTGTLPGSPNEWIGTTNAADFLIKTATVTQMRIRSTGTIYMINDVAIGDNSAPSERLRVLDGSGDRTTVGIVNNVLTTGTALNISSTSTGPGGAISQTDKLLNLSRTGANAFASHTSYGIFSSIANTGTTNTNIGGYFSASGASTGNYAIIVPSGGGNVGIGTSAPLGTLSIVSPNATGSGTSSALNLTASSLTTGSAVNVAGTYAPTTGPTVNAVNYSFTNSPTVASNIIRGNLVSTIDNSALANTVEAVYGYVPLTGNAAKTGIGVYGQVTSSSTTADILYGTEGDVQSTGAISAGTRNMRGLYSTVLSTGANTGGTTNLYGVSALTTMSNSTNGSTVNMYGVHATSSGTGAAASTAVVNQYGLYVANGTSSVNGTSTKYGLYVESQTGADANYGGVFMGGNVGMGLAAPLEQLHITQNFRFPATTSTTGIIKQGAERFIHTYGTANIFMGYQAGNFTTSGTGQNTGVGYQALTSLGTGRYNEALGYRALASASGANVRGNIAIGTLAMEMAATAADTRWNIGIGIQALQYAGSAGVAAQNNTAVGGASLGLLTSGSWNTGVGTNTLASITTGTRNTAMGNSALIGFQTGSENTAIGAYSMYNSVNEVFPNPPQTPIAGGNQNTCLGSWSGATITTGSNNVCIGYAADASAANANSISIGTNVTVTASNTGYFGNSSIGTLKAQVAWGTYSDARIKTNVQENVPGLNFISQLRPVTYQYDIHKENEILGSVDTLQWEGKYDIEKVRFSGFIAQEVEAAARKIGYDFSGVERPKNKNDLYSLRYSEFVIPLVMSVQELNAKNEVQQKTIELLLKRIEALEKVKRAK